MSWCSLERNVIRRDSSLVVKIPRADLAHPNPKNELVKNPKMNWRCQHLTRARWDGCRLGTKRNSLPGVLCVDDGSVVYPAPPTSNDSNIRVLRWWSIRRIRSLRRASVHMNGEVAGSGEMCSGEDTSSGVSESGNPYKVNKAHNQWRCFEKRQVVQPSGAAK
ncbi:hypothetical protein Tco_0910268 [Tanacetum coccineum]|uniref:Uncharacterized protein n=1 Tax=Tanacetum coccineum TaxID=301880 RepID=A0ABQ5CSR8_9ASTR